MCNFQVAIQVLRPITAIRTTSARGTSTSLCRTLHRSSDRSLTCVWHLGLVDHVLIVIYLQENYGRRDAASEKKVKEVFASPEVDVAGRFAKYEQESYDKIMTMINQVDEAKTGLKKQVFTSFLDKVYKRSK